VEAHVTDAPRIIRKKTGHYLEDFRPGQVFRHKGGKTVTEGLFTTFTEFAMTTNPLAKNARYARAYGFDGLVCPPGLAMLVAFSQTVEDVSENARANLEYIDMRFGAPVYVGDTVEVETKVIGLRPSSSRPNLGIVHVQSTARKNVGAADEAIVLTWQRKVQVWKHDDAAELHAGEIEPDPVDCSLWLPNYDAGRDYKALAHLSNPDTYFEDFEPGTRIEHSRGRTMTDEHIHLTAVLDNTSQVHCNQYMIDLDPKQYVGGQLIIFGGIPFVLCLGLSCPDVADNSLGDQVYRTGRHTAPLFAGDTVFAATEILGKRDHPERADLGVLETRLHGHKFLRAEGETHEDAPAGWKKVAIFELDRELVVKRRSHYAG
jgi:2-methylfumaryl-CoA hydratase